MKKLILTIICALAALAASAAETIKVQCPNLVALDEQFNVTFIIEGESSDFQWTPGNDFQLVWGPQRGSSSSISIINGKRTSSSQTSYTYVLSPKSSGRFQLPQASAVSGRDRIVSPSVTIEVVSNGASQQPQQSRQPNSGSYDEPAPAAAPAPRDGQSDIFMRLYLSKNKVVVGEAVTATLKLYQRANIAGFEDAHFPSFNGFWSQELQAPTNIEFQRENVGNLIYNSAVLRSWKLIPQQSGELEIEPSELVCLVNVRTPRASTGSIFDSFFQDDIQTVRRRITAPAQKVRVSGLPAGAPDSFGGGVGQFSLSAALTRDSLKTHEAASLKVTVSGKGNLTMLEAPKISFPPDFEVYDVKVSDTASGRQFEYPFIPRSHGDFVIGPVEYSYYDIQASRYVTLNSAVLPLKVARGAETQENAYGQPLVPSVSRKDVRDLGSDIRYIVSSPSSLSRSGRFFVASPAFIVILALILVAAALYLLLSRRAAARRADVVGSRNRAAAKKARKRLARAGGYLKDNLYTAFYEELHRTLLGFASDKLAMDAADMSRDNIKARLLASGASESDADGFCSLLEACEYARYAPDAGHEAMNAHFESAVSVISSIDESMKHSRKGGASVAAMVAGLLFLLPVSSSAAVPAEVDSLWNKGVDAYAAGMWQEAADAWTAVRDQGLESARLCYNIGNAFFKKNEYGRAVLWYERAHRLDPADKDIRYNLDYAAAMTQDRIEPVPEFFLTTFARRFRSVLGSDSWAVLFLVFLGAFLTALVLFLRGRSTSVRRTGFYGGIALALLAAVSLHSSIKLKNEYTDKTYAIVVLPVIQVRSAPGDGAATELFVLHEGTKVKILDSVGGWDNVEIADGRKGWLKGADIEII